jgi:DNA polymerase-3 subunit delta'
MNDLTILPPWLAAHLAQLMTDPARASHAFLLHGQSGIGKRALGAAFARALLCEAPDAELRATGGCGACPACLWFDQGNHPDFRKVIPEALAVAEGLELAEDGELDDAAEPAGPRSKKAPSKEIRVDQIRALHAFLAVATHRSRFRVVLMYPLETVNDVGANALLKMLEEPPPGTVFVLVADHLGRIPATVVSRCRKVFVATPSIPVATAWLAERGVADPAAALALSGGAPMGALAFAADEDALASHRDFLGFLAKPGVEAALAAAEAFGRSPAAPLVRWMQQWVADCIAVRLAGRVRYHPAQSKTLVQLAGSARLDALMRLMQRLDAVRRAVDHPLNTRLLLESLFTAYADAMVAAKV